MQLFYNVFLDYCIKGPTDDDNVWYRRVQGLPFIPTPGLVLRLTNDESDVFDFTPDIVRYDVDNGRFEADESTDVVRDQFIEGDAVAGKVLAIDIAAHITSFGFARVNFPTRNGRE